MLQHCKQKKKTNLWSTKIWLYLLGN